jgi:hypothetical protein
MDRSWIAAAARAFECGEDARLVGDAAAEVGRNRQGVSRPTAPA